jgi:hypothetical protein
MFRRAQENHVEDDFLKLSRNADEFCGKRDFKTGRVSIEETSIALASGQYDLHYIAMPGRLQVDMYNYFRRYYNLTSYKLDYVGSYFIGDNVVKLEHRVEADADSVIPDGKVTRIFSKNLVLRQGKLGAKSKVLKRVFVKDAVDGESFRGFLEVDTVLPSTIAVESSVRATDNAETVRVFF